MASINGYDRQKWLERLGQTTAGKPSKTDIRQAIDSLHDEVVSVPGLGANDRLVA